MLETTEACVGDGQAPLVVGDLGAEVRREEPLDLLRRMLSAISLSRDDFEGVQWLPPPPVISKPNRSSGASAGSMLTILPS